MVEITKSTSTDHLQGWRRELRPRPHLPGTWNMAIGVTSLVVCILSGMVMGLWAFGEPMSISPPFDDYSSLPRRFIRLGHISFFGLGLLNVLIADLCVRLPFGGHHRHWALLSMNVGNIGLPPLLFAAAYESAFLYLMPIPAAAVLTALTLTACAAWRRTGIASFFSKKRRRI